MDLIIITPRQKLIAENLTDKTFRKAATQAGLPASFCLKGVCSMLTATGAKSLTLTIDEAGERFVKLDK